jgi:hypothetical protein
MFSKEDGFFDEGRDRGNAPNDRRTGWGREQIV